MQGPPAPVAQEIFHQKLCQRSINQQACGNGVHDPDEQKPRLRIWAVRGVESKTYGLSDGSPKSMSAFLALLASRNL